MYCSNCGKQLVENAKFCAGCGARTLVTALPMEEYQRLMAAGAPQPAPQGLKFTPPQPQYAAQPQYPPQPQYPAQPQYPPKPQYPAQPQTYPQPPQSAMDENGYIRTRQSPVGASLGIYYNYECMEKKYVTINAKNLVRQPIKYLVFHIQAYNRVNDPVEEPLTYRYAGPIEYKRKLYGLKPDRVWKEPPYDHFKLEKLDVEFMDGTKVTINGEDVPPFKAPLLE